MIRTARTPEDYAAFAALCRDYVDWCRSRYADLPGFVDAVFGHQSLEAELAKLPVKYGPPNGRTLLLEQDGRIIGAGAWKWFDEGICELKRLYIADAARGAGHGRALTEALLASAREMNFVVARLDTADRLSEAIALYESLGFRRTAPYQPYPADIMPHIVFMECEL
jgi:ribosomal protein S18 acetylase RimI-like enzyme